MTLMPTLTPSSASASPTRTFRSSVSTTQGPAMRNGLCSLPPPNLGAISVGQFCQLPRWLSARMQLLVIERGTYEAREQRMRPHGARLQLGVELAADEPRMFGQLDHFHERPIRRQAGSPQPVLREHIPVGVRDLITMAMPLADFGGVVCLRDA